MKLKQLLENENKYKINWIRPDENYFKQELRELSDNEANYDLLKPFKVLPKTMEMYRNKQKPNQEIYNEIMNFYKSGQPKLVSQQESKNIDNMNKDHNSPKELDDFIKGDKGFPIFKKHLSITHNNLQKNKVINLPMPFVIKLPNGKLHLIGGAKRSIVALAYGIPITVWMMHF